MNKSHLLSLFTIEVYSSLCSQKQKEKKVDENFITWFYSSQALDGRPSIIVSKMIDFM